ncbi:uncharacterized protein MONBRDRAFT_7068 [Monosiga brevicollis MX1]|uniref:DH domain-containing protein n=1 Tax=Monosiga brevicollis TaxID=81824 RepID=A9UVT8_MONBE|nr:uncharacterized protein MONBRDRAFT_7068 [Monosiga brevicollis MX1]EDQ90645.1 predicted protein [Monosiga brevicollis MX1]|eukprot:XP_001744696.1 hypothetical protein [Monosiga brevicollis MX1]
MSQKPALPAKPADLQVRPRAKTAPSASSNPARRSSGGTTSAAKNGEQKQSGTAESPSTSARSSTVIARPPPPNKASPPVPRRNSPVNSRGDSKPARPRSPSASGPSGAHSPSHELARSPLAISSPASPKPQPRQRTSAAEGGNASATNSAPSSNRNSDQATEVSPPRGARPSLRPKPAARRISDAPPGHVTTLGGVADAAADAAQRRRGSLSPTFTFDAKPAAPIAGLRPQLPPRRQTATVSSSHSRDTPTNSGTESNPAAPADTESSAQAPIIVPVRPNPKPRPKSQDTSTLRAQSLSMSEGSGVPAMRPSVPRRTISQPAAAVAAAAAAAASAQAVPAERGQKPSPNATRRMAPIPDEVKAARLKASSEPAHPANPPPPPPSDTPSRTSTELAQDTRASDSASTRNSSSVAASSPPAVRGIRAKPHGGRSLVPPPRPPKVALPQHLARQAEASGRPKPAPRRSSSTFLSATKLSQSFRLQPPNKTSTDSSPTLPTRKNSLPTDLGTSPSKPDDNAESTLEKLEDDQPAESFFAEFLRQYPDTNLQDTDPYEITSYTAKKMRKAVKCETNRHRLKKYPKCFKARDAIEFLIDRNVAGDELEAVRICEGMRCYGMIANVQDASFGFEKGTVMASRPPFYRWRDENFWSKDGLQSAFGFEDTRSLPSVSASEDSLSISSTSRTHENSVAFVNLGPSTSVPPGTALPPPPPAAIAAPPSSNSQNASGRPSPMAQVAATSLPHVSSSDPDTLMSQAQLAFGIFGNPPPPTASTKVPSTSATSTTTASPASNAAASARAEARASLVSAPTPIAAPIGQSRPTSVALRPPSTARPPSTMAVPSSKPVGVNKALDAAVAAAVLSRKTSVATASDTAVNVESNPVATRPPASATSASVTPTNVTPASVAPVAAATPSATPPVVTKPPSDTSSGKPPVLPPKKPTVVGAAGGSASAPAAGAPPASAPPGLVTGDQKASSVSIPERGSPPDTASNADADVNPPQRTPSIASLDSNSDFSDLDLDYEFDDADWSDDETFDALQESQNSTQSNSRSVPVARRHQPAEDAPARSRSHGAGGDDDDLHFEEPDKHLSPSAGATTVSMDYGAPVQIDEADWHDSSKVYDVFRSTVQEAFNNPSRDPIYESVEECRPAEMTALPPPAPAPISELQSKLWRYRQDVIDSGIADSMTKLELRRQDAINEVLETEKTYKANLASFKKQFIVPLLVAARTKVGDQMVNRASDHDDILSKDIVEDLKDCVERLEQTSKALIDDLEERRNENLVVETIVDKFDFHLDALRLALTYYSRVAPPAMHHLGKNSKQVDLFLQQFSEASHKGLTIHSYVIEPVQRVARYPLLMNGILAATPEDSEDYAAMQRLIQQLSDVADECNEIARMEDNYLSLLELEETLDMKGHEPIAGPSRTLIHRGPVKRVLIKDGRVARVKPAELVLLSDMVLILKKQFLGSKSIIKRQIHRKRVRIQDHEGLPGDRPEAQHLFMLFLNKGHMASDMEPFILHCNTAQEKTKWLEAFDPPRDESNYLHWDCPQVVAIADWAPQDSEQLQLNIGQIINVTRPDEGGWSYGYYADRPRNRRLNPDKLFPTNHTITFDPSSSFAHLLQSSVI